MKKILSIVICALCVWLLIIFGVPAKDQLMPHIIPAMLLAVSGTYFITLCLIDSDDDSVF